MSQHDLDIANQTASAARADINLALKALGSTNSGATAPATTYANMLWYDTSSNTLKIRAEADDAWISISYLDQAADAFSVFDDTKLVNASGTQVGLLGDQATATWEGGTGTLESLISPAKLSAASSGVTLLGTLNLTSGNSQTLSGLSLSNYKFLYVVCNAVQTSNGAGSLLLEGLIVSSVTISEARYITLGFDIPRGIRMFEDYVLAAGILGTMSSKTSLTLSISGASTNFGSGTAEFYGVK